MIPKQVLEAEERANAMMSELSSTPEARTQEGEPENQTPPAKPDQSEETLAHRMATMQGMMDANSREMNSYRSQNAELMAEIAALKAKMNAPPPPPPVVDEDLKLIEGWDKTHFKEEYPEQYKIAVAIAEERAQKKVEDLKREIAELKAQTVQVAQKAEQSSSAAFLSDLTSRVADWRQWNRDKDFLGWLKSADRYSGRTREELLDDAVKRGDAGTVANFFDDFKAEKKIPPGKTPETYVSPPKGAGKGLPEEKGDESVARSYIRQVYADYNKGRYRGREDAFAKIESKINAAIAAGKVTDN